MGDRWGRMVPFDRGWSSPAVANPNARQRNRLPQKGRVINTTFLTRKLDKCETRSLPYLRKKRLHPSDPSQLTRARPRRTQTPAPVSGAQISKTDGWGCLSGSMKASGATVLVIPHSPSVHLRLRNGSLLTVHLSGVRVLCAKKEHAAWGEIQANVMKNLKRNTLQRANCSTPVSLGRFNSVQACIHSMWRVCVRAHVCQRERARLSSVRGDEREDQSGRGIILTLSPPRWQGGAGGLHARYVHDCALTWTHTRTQSKWGVVHLNASRRELFWSKTGESHRKWHHKVNGVNRECILMHLLQQASIML